MGPSGCGKSTLLHVLGLMTAADGGELSFDGQWVGPRDLRRRIELRRRKIGFVFQRFNLLGVLSAADNIAISLRVRGLAVDGRIDRLLEELGLSELARRKPGQMSIGQQQRLAVARALAHEPEVIFADEPTGNLDSAGADRLLGVLRDVNRHRGRTVVMITHSPAAAAVADRVVHMRDGVLLDAPDAGGRP
jgi:putative ABC transport system ATP-binding protein